ncbi:hypothetical protein G6L26_005635 [Agrobacterium radiobacter]|uniref:hypothetical protein n=1 Tax=Agrobacterium tumefaciens complex TaxID=1183400 RepID=UPI0011474F32|nr:hypothetical protein [Agrobacterium tumefaciens]NTA04685.1 hypothetical protein [Agrobacterium tumefaciens]NTA91277.1 hypothetical protein [Agrobacterium tumefaciens]NTB12426.1 hypothetical protein [Agrobacterium tumefaciens]
MQKRPGNNSTFAIIAICVWMLVAFTAWHFENSCGMFLSQKCFALYWDGVRWIVLLKWLNQYQQLISGIAALAAGAFVLYAGREQIAHLKESRRNERVQSALDSVYSAGSLVHEYYRRVTTLSAPPEPIPLFESNMQRDIAFISPQLLQQITRVQTYTNLYYKKAQEDSSYASKHKKKMVGYSYCLFQAIRQIANFANDNGEFSERIKLDQFKFDSTNVRSVASRHNLSTADIGSFSRYFSIDEDNEGGR